MSDLFQGKKDICPIRFLAILIGVEMRAGAPKAVNTSQFPLEEYVKSVCDPVKFSYLYGEGDDWTPLYSVRSGQMVGALPVGIETSGMDDAPPLANTNLLDL